MLTYVMDGNIVTAKKSVEPQIERKSDELRLRGDAKIHCSSLMLKGGQHGETYDAT